MSKTSSKNNKDFKEIQAYWTKERRDKAIPKPLPKLPDDGEIAEQSTTTRRPTFTPPDTSIKDENDDQSLNGKLAKPVNSPENLPWRCNGKLFFTWKGDDYVGSAGAILLEVLLTAGHNVFDEGEWSDNFYYYPAYPDYGKSWGWKRASVFTAWQYDANYAYDYAMILTDTSMKDIGSIGCVRDLAPKDRTWTAIGYPSRMPYPGDQMYKTTGNYIAGDSIITMDNNDMTKGSSGGVWLTDFEGVMCVNGIQSTRGGVPEYANSPYIANNDYEKLLKCVTMDECK